MGHWRNMILVVIVSMAILHLSHAHNKELPPKKLPPKERANKEQNDYVDMHNCIRKALGLPPLCWDNKVAKRAKAWSNKLKNCQLVHSEGGGENLAMGPNLTALWAVQLWLDERKNYDICKNQCTGACGHYTQVVWKNTKHLGCARVKCDAPYEGYYAVVCNYDPPGNYIGERPY
ncbi:hypothetical protein L6452_22930 [Arctium lappa]|uniref:Uncharacterized protein n=1 Tax=Arctium lappa TaxID=4217 RepID=A0ACB9B2V0_ARCLA|nr:hypothetical protein L6452_22930 [Arctium lappa]